MRRRWTTFSSRRLWMKPVTSSVGVPRCWSSLRPRGPAAVAAAVADLPLYLSKAVSLVFWGRGFRVVGCLCGCWRLSLGQAASVRSGGRGSALVGQEEAEQVGEEGAHGVPEQVGWVEGAAEDGVQDRGEVQELGELDQPACDERDHGRRR